MHEVSRQRAQAVKHNAKQSEQQGKEIEAFGKTIEASLDVATEAQGKSIEEAGKATRRHAAASCEYAEEADRTGSEAAFTQAASEHFKERNEVIKAVEVYGEVIRSQGKRAIKALDPDREPSKHDRA